MGRRGALWLLTVRADSLAEEAAEALNYIGQVGQGDFTPSLLDQKKCKPAYR
jgi:hypothetical protein